MDIQQGDMTPAGARRLLAANTRNRKLVPTRVARLAGQIQRGEWQVDGSPIRISVTGVVLDGQHRLAAIMQAGVTVPGVVIITGLDDDAQMVMDTGKPRTFEDHLFIEGVPSSRQAAGTTMLLSEYEAGKFTGPVDWFNHVPPSHAQLWEFFTTRREDITSGVAAASRAARYVRASRAVLAAAHVIFGDITCDQCEPARPDRDVFYDALTGRVQGHSGVTLFIKMMNGKNRDRPSALTSGYSQRVQLALVMKAWNAYREGRAVSTLRFTLGGASPEKFPVPH
jgi:hypothetical protein